MTVIAAVLLVAVGALLMASEWSHRSVQPTFLAVPSRNRVLAAKYAAAAIVGIGVAVATLVLGGATLAACLAIKGWGFHLVAVAPGVALGMTAGLVLWMLLTAGVGALVPNSPAAVVVGYFIPLVVPVAVLAFSATWSARLNTLGALGALTDGSGTSLWRAVATLGGWVVPIAIGAVVVTNRRDVS